MNKVKLNPRVWLEKEVAWKNSYISEIYLRRVGTDCFRDVYVVVVENRIKIREGSFYEKS